MDDQDERRLRYERNGREVLDGGVVELRIQARDDCKLRGGTEECVSVGLRPDDGFNADRTARARAVVDDHALAE